jgi:hypothetical protein
MWIINLWFNILSHAAIFWVQTWVEVWYKFILIFLINYTCQDSNSRLLTLIPC